MIFEVIYRFYPFVIWSCSFPIKYTININGGSTFSSSLKYHSHRMHSTRIKISTSTSVIHLNYQQMVEKIVHQKFCPKAERNPGHSNLKLLSHHQPVRSQCIHFTFLYQLRLVISCNWDEFARQIFSVRSSSSLKTPCNFGW